MDYAIQKKNGTMRHSLRRTVDFAVAAGRVAKKNRVSEERRGEYSARPKLRP